MNHIEIELRYQVLEVAQLEAFLAPFEKLHQKHDIDIYLDNEQATLYQKGIYVRIRNNKKLDIKFNRATLDNPDLVRQDYCEEHSFALPLHEKDVERLNGVLRSLGLLSVETADIEQVRVVNNFIERCVVDKIRTSYASDCFIVCLDEISGLGTFLEIELMASGIEKLCLVKEQMQQLVSGLDVVPVKTGYIELLLRKNNFACYLLGRFVLEEDKIYKAQLFSSNSHECLR